ncbi:MAG: hypothetical protein Q9196_004515, partial [Gyalolechia fulgens]
PLDLSVLGPLKTYLGRETDRITRCGASRIRKHAWLKTYQAARPMARREKTILGGFKAGGLYPYPPSHVLRHLPPPPSTPNLMLTQATRRGFQLYKINAALRRMLASCRGLTSPAKRYISKLADISARMEPQLAIAEKEAKEREGATTGKEAAVDGHKTSYEISNYPIYEGNQERRH